jgi:hypothetical protein
MAVDLSDFKKPVVVLSLVASFVAGAAFFWYTVGHQIPELEKREDKQDKAISDKFAEISGSVDKQFTSMRGDIHDQLSSLGLTVQGLRTNVILLCAQRRPLSANCDVKALVAEAKRSSQIQAEYFAAADVKLIEGSKPRVADEGLEKQLPGYAFAYTSTAHRAEAKAQVASAILWSSAADSARWHQEGNKVVVVFANGMASFDLSAPGTKEQVGDLVQSLNATTNALKAAGSLTPEKK